MPAGAEAVGMKKLLGTYFICEMRVPVAKLIKTSIGRELRSAGVNHLKECIERDGFLEQFAPVVSLMKPLSDGESLEDVMPVEGFKLKIIDGNHRVRALELIDGEKGTATSINCRVHGVMSPSAERMVAAGEAFCKCAVMLSTIHCRCQPTPSSTCVLGLTLCGKRNPFSSFCSEFVLKFSDAVRAYLQIDEDLSYCRSLAAYIR